MKSGQRTIQLGASHLAQPQSSLTVMACGAVAILAAAMHAHGKRDAAEGQGPACHGPERLLLRPAAPPQTRLGLCGQLPLPLAL